LIILNRLKYNTIHNTLKAVQIHLVQYIRLSDVLIAKSVFKT